MFITDIPLHRVYELIEPGGIGCEVGVKTGKNAQRLLDLARPSQLYLIDPWGKDADDPYFKYEDRNKMLGLFAHVSRWAETKPNVRVIRDYSYVAAKQFSENFFDWVYVDGIHDYKNLYRDLASFAPKLKPKGFLLGDDYDDLSVLVNKRVMNPEGPNLRTLKAVRDFCRDYGFELVLLSNDVPPKFLLAREDCQARTILTRVLSEAKFVIEIDPMALRHGIAPTGRIVMRSESRAFSVRKAIGMFRAYRVRARNFAAGVVRNLRKSSKLAAANRSL
jgi:hypothetical protein